ncbi:MAG TPA: PepSY domain-containing protein [Gemmatimonadaceae bacterium]|nr:PepSY domain-containing protein [Gemmatimonadaceae bacterium]
MFKVIAVAIAIAATTTVAGAQATSASKAAVKPAAQTSASASRIRRRSVKKETQADLQKEAKISEADARATALKEVPNGTVKSEELEREKGKLVYSYDISVAGKSGVEEVTVSAIDGSVVNKMHESARTERKEAAGRKTTK